MRAILRQRIDFPEGNIPKELPTLDYLKNVLLYGSALLSHDDGKSYDDGRRRINFCNFEAAKIFGRTVEDLLGTPSEELAPDVGSIREERKKALDESLSDWRLLSLSDERRLQLQTDGSLREILIDAILFPYMHKGFKSHAASITFKGYYPLEVAKHP